MQIRNKLVISRKSHFCNGCGREILKNSPLVVSTRKEGNNILINYWCKSCDNYWRRITSKNDGIEYEGLCPVDREGWGKLSYKCKTSIGVVANRMGIKNNNGKIVKNSMYK